MTDTYTIILHQILFQGMFVLKNMLLQKKLGKKIRGKNKEATLSILYFSFFIIFSLLLTILKNQPGRFNIMDGSLALSAGAFLIVFNLVISAFSLISLKDSWRVGVLEDQKTELISTGIYRYSRNPYFLSYLLMFAAYTILLQNVLLLFLSAAGFIFIHKMILKEEKYLHSVHGESYSNYRKKTPRYFIV